MAESKLDLHEWPLKWFPCKDEEVPIRDSVRMKCGKDADLLLVQHDMQRNPKRSQSTRDDCHAPIASNVSLIIVPIETMVYGILVESSTIAFVVIRVIGS